MKTIFVVDDDFGPRQAVVDALEDQYTLVPLEDIDTALGKAIDDGEPVDMIITDYHLGRSGTASKLIQEIRSETDQHLKNLPIIVYSSDESLRGEVEREGNVFIRKPLRPVELRKIVAEKLGVKAQGG
jgi:DNA-binding NtrC family response regulator